MYINRSEFLRIQCHSSLTEIENKFWREVTIQIPD